MWNKHKESPLILLKYVKVHQCTSQIMLGRGDIPMWQRWGTFIHHVCYHLFVLLHRLQYTWHLQLVVNEVVHLIIVDVHKARHMGLCWKHFRINKIRIETSPYKYSLFNWSPYVRMWPKVYIPSLKLACPVALTPFNSTHQLINFSRTKP